MKITNPTLFGARLKASMKVADIDAQRLAKKIGVANSSVYRWINGDISNPGRDTLNKLAAALGVDLDYLMGYTDDPNFKHQDDFGVARNALTYDEEQIVIKFMNYLHGQRQRWESEEVCRLQRQIKYLEEENRALKKKIERGPTE